MMSVLNTAWLAVKDGPQAALYSALYDGTSWAGIKASEGLTWVGSVVGDAAAQLPDWVISKVTFQNSNDFCYNKITNTSTFIFAQADKLNKTILDTVAPNAAKAGFGFSEIIGPSFAIWFTASYTIEHGFKTYHKIRELTAELMRSKDLQVYRDGVFRVVNREKDRKKKLAREALIYTLGATIFGFATYFLANGLDRRLTEAGITKEHKLYGLGILSAPYIIPPILQFFERKKQDKEFEMPHEGAGLAYTSKDASIYVPGKGRTTKYRSSSPALSPVSSSSGYSSSSWSSSSSPSLESSVLPKASLQSTLGRPLVKKRERSE